VRKIVEKKNYFVIWVLLPVFVYYSIFFLYPFISAFLLSFYNWNILTPKKPVGFSNYYRALFKDKIFWIVLKNTIYYIGGVVSAVLVLGLIIALLLNSIKRFRSVFRLMYFIPVMTALVACAIIWKFLYQPSFGLFNVILNTIGLPSQDWLQSTKLALPSVMLMSIWRDAGFVAMIFVAGLQGIPESFNEAARVDGANKLQNSFYITLPLLQPTIIFVLLTTLIRTFQVFTQIYIMTRGTEFEAAGGPNHATEVMVLLIFKEGIERLHVGYASALSIFLLIILVSISIVNLKFGKTKWEY
jgi:multiple sugar transport system permease protein